MLDFFGVRDWIIRRLRKRKKLHIPGTVVQMAAELVAGMAAIVVAAFIHGRIGTYALIVVVGAIAALGVRRVIGMWKASVSARVDRGATLLEWFSGRRHLADQPPVDDVSRKRIELSALIQEGDALAAGMRFDQHRTEDRMAETIRLKIEVMRPLGLWLDSSWEWVKREAPDWLGLVRTVDEWPKKVAAVDSYPKLVAQRLAELRDVLKRL